MQRSGHSNRCVCQCVCVAVTHVKRAKVELKSKKPAHAGEIVTEEQKGILLKVVPERDGHRLELQWSVPPESEAYKTFPCSYLRCVPSFAQLVPCTSNSNTTDGSMLCASHQLLLT